ncbi:Flagellar basal body-associated protein FliL [Fontimonas thermophila]|uniref:Flagellar basal body-associated protein FliL n=2 Tax=Fontimonas thermophila TaxID=1076937 RepID=A0A1I2JE27_9GAMM|nr:Flagellar basal body-associated protein FliL [Fontimonas thermophila]
MRASVPEACRVCVKLAFERACNEPTWNHAPMNRGTWTSLFLALVLVTVGAGYYLYRERSPHAPEPEPTLAQPVPDAEPEEATPHLDDALPVQDRVPDEPMLPALDDSDAAMREALVRIFGATAVASWLVPERLIRNAVATIDSLDRDPVRLRLRPLKPVPGRLLVIQDGPRLLLGPENAQRYQPYVDALRAVDTQALVALYRRWYPRLQQAYAELGYPDRSFNDRLIEIIDHLRATPEVRGPLVLLPARGGYAYADETLESWSSGRKILLRLGSTQAAVVKAKLGEIRAELVGGRRAQPAP